MTSNPSRKHEDGPMIRSITPSGRKTTSPFPAGLKWTAAKDFFVGYACLTEALHFASQGIAAEYAEGGVIWMALPFSVCELLSHCRRHRVCSKVLTHFHQPLTMLDYHLARVIVAGGNLSFHSLGK
jgi:hypothetical protein